VSSYQIEGFRWPSFVCWLVEWALYLADWRYWLALIFSLALLAVLP
jgi:hypothetical protein